MPLYTNIIIALLIIVGVGVGVFFLIRKLKSTTTQRIIKSSLATDEESRIIQTIRDIMNVKTTMVFIYKDAELWGNVMKSVNLPETTRGITLRAYNEVHIRRYGDTDSNKLFAQLVLHEFNHILGMEHSDAMTNEDMKITTQVFIALGYV